MWCCGGVHWKCRRCWAAVWIRLPAHPLRLCSSCLPTCLLTCPPARLPACLPGPISLPARPPADIVILHDALDFGQCHLGLGVPMGGRFADVNSLEELRAMPWSEQAPLRWVLPACRRSPPIQPCPACTCPPFDACSARRVYDPPMCCPPILLFNCMLMCSPTVTRPVCCPLSSHSINCVLLCSSCVLSSYPPVQSTAGW